MKFDVEYMYTNVIVIQHLTICLISIVRSSCQMLASESNVGIRIKCLNQICFEASCTYQKQILIAQL